MKLPTSHDTVTISVTAVRPNRFSEKADKECIENICPI